MFEETLSLQRLGDTHRALLTDLRRLDDLAADLGEVDDSESQALGEVLAFLRGRLEAHMEFEELVVYPVMAEEVGAAAPLEWMIEDHREIRRWVDELATRRAQLEAGEPAASGQVRRALAVISALVHLHLRKEEAAYAWLLERRMHPRDLEHPRPSVFTI